MIESEICGAQGLSAGRFLIIFKHGLLAGVLVDF